MREILSSSIKSFDSNVAFYFQWRTLYDCLSIVRDRSNLCYSLCECRQPERCFNADGPVCRRGLLCRILGAHSGSRVLPESAFGQSRALKNVAKSGSKSFDKVAL